MTNQTSTSIFRPIFVVGNSRSGTTLMGSILGLNSAVFTFEELHFFGTLWSQSDRGQSLSKEQGIALAAKLLAIQDEDVISHKDPELFRSEAYEVLANFENQTYSSVEVLQEFLSYIVHQNNCQIPCEQTPRNVLYIKELLDFFPDCRIINMVRDPRDVLLSQKYKWKIRFLGASNIPYREAVRAWANYHAVTTSKLWNAAIEAAAQYADHERVTTIRFEDLLTQPESIIKAACNFIQLDFTPAMLQVSQSEGGVSSHKKVTPGAKGIDSSATGKWKRGGLTKTEIYLCQKITRSNMQQHNYTVEKISANPIQVMLSWLFLPIKLILALLFNLQRVKNIWEEIKRRM